MATKEIKDKMLGCLYGQAIGDALGLGSEFMNKDEVLRNYPDGLKHYDQIIQDSHRSKWEKGAWTDDTDMMLCILNGYENGAFNLREIARNFKDWFNSNPMDIGIHTYELLSMDEYVGQPEKCTRLCWDLSQQKSAANGALMRTSVLGLVQDNEIEQAEAICRLSHYDPRCVGSCVIAVSIIHNLIWHDRELSYGEIKDIASRYDNRILQWVDTAYKNNDISRLDLDEPGSIGYTLRTLSAALWYYWHSPSFESGLLSVVNEGGDADTNGAIAGAILGAKFGYSSISGPYKTCLYKRQKYHEQVTSFIQKLLT